MFINGNILTASQLNASVDASFMTTAATFALSDLFVTLQGATSAGTGTVKGASFQLLAAAINGSGPQFSATFVGSGLAANMTASSAAARDTSATPFVASQRAVTSNFGITNPGINFTVGESVSVLGGPNSGNLYALNPIAQGYAGAGGYQLTVSEFNLNNIGADALVLGASTAAYGISVTGAGTARSTAGFRAYGLPGPAGFNYGFGTHGNIVGAAFYDASTGASASFVGQSGLMAGSVALPRQAMIHGYSQAGNAFQILEWLEQDNAGTGTAAIGLSVSYSGTETRSAKAGFGLTRSAVNGRGALTAYNRQTNDAASFTAADAQMSWGLTTGFSGQNLFFNIYQETTASLPTQAECVAHFGIVSGLGGTNPSAYYKAGLTFDATANPGSGYIWGENGVVNLSSSLARATTGASGTGTTATITFGGGTIIPVGQSIKVYGVTPVGYNAVVTVTASSAGSVSYASAATGAQTVAGVVAEYIGAIGSEIDVNIGNAAYDGKGGPFAAGYYVTGTVANNSVNGTGAFVAAYGAASGTLFNYGMLLSETSTGKLAKTAGFSDQTTSPVVLHSNTGHISGVDFSTATFSGGSALISANNTNVSFLDNGAVPRVAIAIDAANNLQLGAAALATLTINTPKIVVSVLPPNYANDAAAAAGGLGIGGIYRTGSAWMVRVA